MRPARDHLIFILGPPRPKARKAAGSRPFPAKAGSLTSESTARNDPPSTAVGSRGILKPCPIHHCNPPARQAANLANYNQIKPINQNEAHPKSFKFPCPLRPDGMPACVTLTKNQSY